MTRFLSPPATIGLKAAALWVVVEIGMILLSLILLSAASIPLVSKRAFVVLQLASITGVLLLAAIFRRKMSREDQNWQDLGYTRLSRQISAVGILAGAALLLFIAYVTQPVDLWLFPHAERIIAELKRSLREGGLPGATLLLIGNGIFTPFTEEFVWRGYIQSKLVLGWGDRVGVIATALLFAAKHIVADVALIRLITLLLFSFTVGLIRVRWGTTATTVVHLLANLVATISLIAEAL